MNKNSEVIHLHHGSGGEHMTKLLNEVIFKILKNDVLEVRHDGAFLNLQGNLAFSTDSYVVSPIFFKGGNIGELAVNGTVNDLSMCGAVPKYLSLALIIEEGFGLDEFTQIIKSIKEAADKANVQIVTGDTKVVEKGKGDHIYINTSGIGVVHEKANIKIENIKEGDAIIINGAIASHGMAIMSEREGLEFESDILSDTINLNHTIKDLMDRFGDKIHFLRDATRGGLASVLNEIAVDANLGIAIFEEKIKVENQVRSACELLGLDPLYVANEGVFVCIAASEIKEEVVQILQKINPNASEIGFVTAEHPSKIIIESAFGGKRVIKPLVGEQLPRIC
ncbi:hydrogenase expression/formation protein HypE [Flavobacterium endoglycinae]|uniref:Hydrogenase expression/formation protein HypE n=1 Tax=Flavobacterium endoglycinae TaxID=2816357 RepID=A0ABX7QAN6_9FLAO|nr:hydrogenase expression/formation protein HypE [Flavobacterium endoglycinae]QSW88084.1 hydrogenase expression/formation protein HypE [Flavobacterium endoglycinae]